MDHFEGVTLSRKTALAATYPQARVLHCAKLPISGKSYPQTGSFGGKSMRAQHIISVVVAVLATGGISAFSASLNNSVAQSFVSNGNIGDTGLTAVQRQRVGNVGPTSFQSVAVVERLLAANGFSPGPVDGVLDNATRNAIRTFQRQNSLAETGQIDLQLSTALTAHILDFVPGSTMQLTVAPGANAAVAEKVLRANRALVQRILARSGIEPGRIDGTSNPITTQAIRTFQSRFGLPVDGSVTPQLVAALTEFDRTSNLQVLRGANGNNTGMQNRPGFAADAADAINFAEGSWNVRAIANGRLIPLEGTTGAVRIEGFLVNSLLARNQPIFRSSNLVTGDQADISLGFDQIAINWGGFLNIDTTGSYEFGLQVLMQSGQNSAACNFSLMLKENNQLVSVLNLRTAQSTSAPEKVSLFLERGLHRIDLWAQCDDAGASDNFALNLLMRSPDSALLQPIRSSKIFASGDDSIFVEQGGLN